MNQIIVSQKIECIIFVVVENSVFNPKADWCEVSNPTIHMRVSI